MLYRVFVSLLGATEKKLKKIPQLSMLATFTSNFEFFWTLSFGDWHSYCLSFRCYILIAGRLKNWLLFGWSEPFILLFITVRLSTWPLLSGTSWHPWPKHFTLWRRLEERHFSTLDFACNICLSTRSHHTISYRLILNLHKFTIKYKYTYNYIYIYIIIYIYILCCWCYTVCIYINTIYIFG